MLLTKKEALATWIFKLMYGSTFTFSENSLLEAFCGLVAKKKKKKNLLPIF